MLPVSSHASPPSTDKIRGGHPAIGPPNLKADIGMPALNLERFRTF